jgi:hypothetical protein
MLVDKRTTGNRRTQHHRETSREWKRIGLIESRSEREAEEAEVQTERKVREATIPADRLHIEKGLDDVTGARRNPRKCESGIEATVG